MTPTTLVPDLCRMLSERLGLPRESVVPEARLVDDLGIDSLDALEIAISLERQFGITVDEERLQDLVTVADVIRLVEPARDP